MVYFSKPTNSAAGDTDADNASILSKITDKVVSFIIEKLLNGVRLNSSLYARVGAIASGMISFFSGIATAFSFAKFAKGTSKFILYINPISSLTTLVLDLYSLLYDTGILGVVADKFSDFIASIKSNISSVVDVILDNVNKIPFLKKSADPHVEELRDILSDGGNSNVQSNALSPTQQIGLATSLLTLVFVSGASCIGWKIAEINNFLRLRMLSFSTAREFKNAIVEILEDLGIYDLSGKAGIISDVEVVLESAYKLRLSPISDFVLDSAKFANLIETIKSIKDIQKRALHGEVKKAITQHLAKLDKEYNALMGLYKQIQDLLSEHQRQNCVGVILEGDGGIGKSHFAKWLLTEVGKKLGYGQSIYDASRGSSKRFNKPYAFQSLGIMNEFAAQRTEDMDYLEDINKILSSDPYGFESASEELKYQPCQLKLVVFTSNANKYDFTKKMTEGSNIAMMSRFIRVQVRDKDYVADRNDIQAHRKPDYSHLECQIVTPKHQPNCLSDCWNLKAAPIAAKNLVDYLIPIIAMHETNHVLSLIEETKDNPEMVKSLNERLVQLKVISESCEVIEPKFGQYTSFHATSGNKQVVYKNANEPMIFHFAGPPGVGKSIAAKTIAAKLKRLYNLEVRHVDQNNIAASSKDTVYIVDDYPFHDHASAQKYLDLTNNMTAHSMIILTTNHAFDTYCPKAGPIRYISKWLIWATSGIWDIPAPRLKEDSYWSKIFTTTPGLVRRVGFPFESPDHCYSPRTSQNYAEFNRMGLPSIVSTSEETSIIKNVCDAYTKFIQSNKEILVIDATPSITTFDLDINLKDVEAAIPLLSNTMGLFKLLQGQKCGRVTVNMATAIDKCPRGLISEWLLPSVAPGTDYLDIAKAYAERIRLVCPRMTFKLTVPWATVFYCDSVLYAASGNEANVVVGGDGLMSVFGEKFSPSDFAKFYLNPSLFASINLHFNYLQLETAKLYYEDHIEELPLYKEAVEHAANAGKWSHKFKPVIDFLSSNTGLKIIAWIFGIVAVLGLAKICYDYFFGAVKDSVRCNAGDSTTSSDISERYDWMTAAERAKLRDEGRMRVKSHNWEPPKKNANKDEIMKVALETALDCEYSAKPYLQLTNQLPPPFKDYFQAKKNAVPPEFENLHIETSFSSAVKKVRKNLARFCGKLNCYGIFIKKQLCVVPCHAIDFDNPDNNCIYWSPDFNEEPTRYNAKIVAYTTAKDIAVVQAVKAPNMKDISRLLPRGALKTWTATACYVRPLEQTEMCWGVAHYNPVKAIPLGKEDWFHPIDYIHFDQVTFGARAIYQRGDCGMPLIGLIENEAILLGFHIALNNNDEGWFSPLCVEDLEHIEETYPNATFPSSVVKGFEHCADVPMWNGVMSKLSPNNPVSTHPEIPVLGTFNSNFSIHPWPDKKRVWFHDPENPLNFPLETEPSPTRLKMLRPEARELLPKLDDGKPSALLAQTKKYFTAAPFRAAGEYFDYAVWAQSQMLQMVCGTDNKPLRTHEVINGMLGSSLKHLTMDSSAGPHMKYFYNVHKKEPLFKLTQESPPVYGFNLDTEAGKQLVSDYKAILECWSFGRPTTVVIKDNPKVEILPIEDTITGKLRLFCEMDLALNMALRRYFGAVFNKIADSTLEGRWKLAWNPYICPDRVVNSCNSGFDIICIDVKRMDKNLHSTFTKVLCKQVNSCYKDSCEVDFNAIAETMSQAIHIQGDFVYTQKGGNHSGSFLTTPLNTLSCDLICLYAFICKFVETFDRLPSLKEIITYFVFAGCGDDVWTAWHPKLGMTYEYLAQKFLECGLEIVENKNTNEHTKYGELCSRIFRPLSETSGVFIGCLKKRSILKSIHWVKTSKINMYAEIVMLAIFEASFWEESFFDKVVADVKRIMGRRGLAVDQLALAPYKAYREHLVKYIRGYSNSPVVTSTGHDIFGAIVSDKQPQELHLSAIYEYFTAFPGSARSTLESATFNKESSTWTTTVRDKGYIGVGSSPFACASRGLAYKELYRARVPSVSSATCEA